MDRLTDLLRGNEPRTRTNTVRQAGLSSDTIERCWRRLLWLACLTRPSFLESVRSWDRSGFCSVQPRIFWCRRSRFSFRSTFYSPPNFQLRRPSSQRKNLAGRVPGYGKLNVDVKMSTPLSSKNCANNKIHGSCNSGTCSLFSQTAVLPFGKKKISTVLLISRQPQRSFQGPL